MREDNSYSINQAISFYGCLASKENSEGYEEVLVKLASIFAKLTLCYEHREYLQLTGWYEYQVADDTRRYVPIYCKADRIRAKQFWKKDWDGDLE
jgi:hypothetical protein